MKTKRFFLTGTIAAVAVIGLFSCTKSATVKPTATTAALSGSWTVASWGGVSNNPLTFYINTGTATGLVTSVSSQPFGWVVGDKLLTNITANSDGSFSATGMYTYGVNNVNSGTRPATVTLQNNNTQLSIDYPAQSSSLPELEYVFQRPAL